MRRGFFKVRAAKNGISGLVAWGALQRLTADDAVSEPANPVHFRFDSTEDGAIKKLCDEITAEYDDIRLVRQ